MSTEEGYKEKFRECILGLAIGDALGMPWEFMIPEDIVSSWNGVDYEPGRAQAGLGPGQYSDDTLSMKCLLDSIVSRGTFDVDDFGRRLVDWYLSGDLRGMGRTTMSALQGIASGQPLDNNTVIFNRDATNGAAMRVAPLGLFYCHDDQKLRETVKLASGLTHRHTEALAGALAVSYAVAHSIRGDVPAESIMEEAADFAAPSIVSERLGFAQDLFNRGVDCVTAIRKLGNTLSVMESVPSAIFCACTHQGSYKKSVVSAIMGGGDTDTIGSITGAICGARLGLDEIPPGWVTGLENSTGLLSAADGLYKLWQQKVTF